MKLSGQGFPLKLDLISAGSGFFALMALSAVLSFFAHSKYSEVPAEQPVGFNHRIHVEDEGLDCSACHQYYERESFSGFPSMNACALCHGEAQGESEEEAIVVRAIEEGVALEWAHLFRQPPHVYFSHRRHVVAAKLDCTTCHGDIGLSERPPARPVRLTMDACIACHKESAVSQDCVKCHR